MSRLAVVAAFIAGAAVVAVAMVVVSPAERAPPTLQEKLMMLKCYKAHVCYLPTDIYCSKGVGACGDDTTKTTCGSGADKAPCQSGVNYQAGWTLPQGCSSTCASDTTGSCGGVR